MTITAREMDAYTTKAQELARAGDILGIAKLADEARQRGASQQYVSNIERYTEAAVMARQRRNR